MSLAPDYKCVSVRYEREFTLFLCYESQANIVETFDLTYLYLNDLLNIVIY